MKTMVAAFLTTLAVALGITYGWQPDPGSDAGEVQYIVQISPDQVGRLSQLGDITSTIDPSIRSRVSRIVIRVGDGPVPKITPSRNQMRSGLERAATSGPFSANRNTSLSGDLAPIPIPEMPLDGHRQSLQPIAGIDSARSSGTSLMKPNPDGFSLPPSMADAANEAKTAFSNTANNMLRETAQNTANQFGNEIKQRGSGAINDIRNAFGRGPANPTGNPSTSGNAAATAPRSIVPPPSPSSGGLTFAGNQAGGPSTDASSRDATYQRYTNRGTVGQTAAPSTGAFGAPGAFTPPNTNANANVRYQNDQYQNDQRQNNSYSNNPYPATARGSAQSEFVGPQVPSDWRYGTADQNSGSQNNSLQSRGMLDAGTNRSADNRTNANETFGRVPASLQGMAAQNDPRNSQGRGQTGLNSPAAPPLLGPGALNQTTQPQPATASDRPDPTLDQDQLAVGGWSFVANQLYDKFNRVIDPQTVRQQRERRIYEAQQRQRYDSDPQRYASRDPQASIDAGSSSQWPNDTALPSSARTEYPTARSDYNTSYEQSLANNRQTQIGASDFSDPRYSTQIADTSADLERQRMMQNEQTRYQNDLRDSGRDFNRGVSATRPVPTPADSDLQSPSDRREAYDENDRTQTSDSSSTRTHSNQSLINGLLLFSGIANVYLFHLLRGIRVRYRDLVSNRRMNEVAA
jgi:hypothetical protein